MCWQIRARFSAWPASALSAMNALVVLAKAYPWPSPLEWKAGDANVSESVASLWESVRLHRLSDNCKLQHGSCSPASPRCGPGLWKTAESFDDHHAQATDMLVVSQGLSSSLTKMLHCLGQRSCGQCGMGSDHGLINGSVRAGVYKAAPAL